MKPLTHGGRRAAVFLAISAVLFAPATFERSSGLTSESRGPLGARVLAPTVREGLIATGPKFSSRLLNSEDERSLLLPFAFGIPAAGAAVLLILGSSVAGLPSRRRSPSLTFFRNPIPRGPPRPLAAQT